MGSAEFGDHEFLHEDTALGLNSSLPSNDHRNSLSSDINQTVAIQTNLSAAVLREIHGKKLLQIGDLFQRQRIPLPSQTSDPPWQQYPTTVLFILVLHVLFLYQFNKKRRRNQVTTNYHHLVQRKRFYQLWIAALSHPPLPSSYNCNCSCASLSWLGAANPLQQHYRNRQGRQYLEILQNVFKSLVAACQGPFAGMVLMLYNSHILWSVRALEREANSQLGPLSYARALLALTSCSLLLELGIFHAVLRGLLRLNRQNPGLQSQQAELRRKFTHQAVGTCTSLAGALIIVFNETFQRVPIAIMPILPNPRLFLQPGWSVLFSLAVLSFLSSNAQGGKLRVLCGIWIGLFWSTGLLSFLADAYWGNWWMAWLAIATLTSYKANFRDSLSWIDSVAWDSKGGIQPVSPIMELVVTEEETRLMERDGTTSPVDDSDNDDDDDDEERDDHRRDDAQGSIELPAGSDDVEIYGRLPELDGDSDVEEDDTERRGLLQANRRQGLMRSRSRRNS